MAERNDGVPPDRRMLFRVGINLGDVLVEGDDILGDGVNVAARLEVSRTQAAYASHPLPMIRFAVRSRLRSPIWGSGASKTLIDR